MRIAHSATVALLLGSSAAFAFPTEEIPTSEAAYIAKVKTGAPEDIVAKLEESLEARSTNGGDAAHDSAGIANQVRQLDERLQKLAYVLAQQNWNRP